MQARSLRQQTLDSVQSLVEMGCECDAVQPVVHMDEGGIWIGNTA
jgi:hypothetical protein